MHDAATPTEPIPAHRAKLANLYSPRFNGYAYFGFANAVALAAMAGAAWFLHGVRPLEWLTLPVTFLVANVIEWAAHRGPLHHRRDWMEILFERHTLTHHIYFPHDDMTAHSHREWGYVLFPAWAIFLVLLTAAPLAAAAGWIFGLNAGLLFFIVGVGYYLVYEWLHLIHHLPEEHPVAQVGLFKRLRRHHTYHHHVRLMQRYNFNVTFPIADYLFGTAYRPQTTPEADAAPEAEASR